MSIVNYKEFNNIRYEISNIDEDDVTITAYTRDERIGYIRAQILLTELLYTELDEFDYTEIDEIFTEAQVCKIEYLKVENDYRGKGIAKELTKRLIELMESIGINRFYLNASPMGMAGLNLQQLVHFYKNLGFKEWKNQGNNVLMYI